MSFVDFGYMYMYSDEWFQKCTDVTFDQFGKTVHLHKNAS